MHICPMVTGLVPHVGGPILPPGEPTVLIGGMPAARWEIWLPAQVRPILLPWVRQLFHWWNAGSPDGRCYGTRRNNSAVEIQQF
jgi:hypothetical protein